MLIKLVQTIVKGYYVKPTFAFFDVVKTTATTMPWHMDFNMHVNNAVYLRFLEAARWDHAVLTGSAKRFFELRCRFIVAGVELSYIRELKPLQKFAVHTQILGADEKYLYLRQQIFAGGKLCNTALIKAVYVVNGKIAPPESIFSQVTQSPTPTLPAEIASWQQLNQDKRASASAS